MIANRVNLSVPSLVAANRGSYFPSWMEFAITLALLTAGVVAFAFAAKHLPVFTSGHDRHESPAHAVSGSK